nr:PREDICTED: uncharacterized protein LOC100878543 isoform X2 [Megachile rotundata]
MPINGTRPKEPLFGVCYVFMKADDHFAAVFLHLGWTTFVTVYNVSIVDSLYILIIHHVCGMFDVCGYQIETATQEPELRYDQFKQCVMTHHKALLFFDKLQECSQNMFLLLVALNMILISMTAVQVNMSLYLKLTLHFTNFADTYAHGSTSGQYQIHSVLSVRTISFVHRQPIRANHTEPQHNISRKNVSMIQLQLVRGTDQVPEIALHDDRKVQQTLHFERGRTVRYEHGELWKSSESVHVVLHHVSVDEGLSVQLSSSTNHKDNETVVTKFASKSEVT